MKKAILFLSILLAIAVCQWRIAESKCCPPPPATTGPVRTLPRSQRTTPPNTDITLPPQTTMPNQTVTAPSTTNPGPVTASQGQSGSRTTASHGGGMTTAPTNANTTSINSGRPTANTVTPPNNTQTTAGTPGNFSTVPPTISLDLPGGTNSPIIEAEFAWEDWWNSNIGFLLATYELKEEESYTKTDIVEDDIPKVITLLAYRGLFDRGIYDIVERNLQGMGAEKVVPVLSKIIQKKYKLKSGKNRSKSISERDYQSLAIRALGYLNSSTEATDAVAAVLLKGLAVKGQHTVANPVDTLLSKAIKDSSVQMRFWACMSLGKLGNEDYIPVLAKVLEKDRDKYVRIAAAEGIAMIGGAKAVSTLEKGFESSKRYYQVQTYVAGALGYVGAADPIDDIRKALKSENGDVRAAATWALAHVITTKIEGKKPYIKLMKELEVAIKSESDPVICRSKALAFLISPNTKLIDLYSKFLSYQRDSSVRAYAALALGYTGSPDAVPHLVALKADSDENVEKAAAYATAMLVSGKMEKVSIDMFESSEKNDVLLAAAVLGVSRYMDADDAYKMVYPLRSHKGESKVVVRAASFSFACLLGEKGFKQAIRAIKDRDADKAAFAYIGIGINNTIDALAALKNKAKVKEVKQCALIAKGLMGGLPLVAALKSKVEKGKDQLKAASLSALGSLNRPEEIMFILDKAENDPSYKARAYALAGFANVKVPEEMEEKVIAQLVKILKDDKQHYMTRGYAALMLSKFPDSREAYEAVRKGANESHSDICAMAAISLGMFRNPAAIKDIKNVITKGRSTPLAYAGYIGLGMMRDKANLEKVISDFEFADQPDQFIAMSFAIAKSASRDTYAKLLKYLKNPDVYLREFTIKCFAMMDNLTEESRKEIIDALKDLEKDDDMAVRLFSGVTRYSFGDKTGLKIVLDTVVSNDFFFDGKVGEDYTTLMELINDSMPMFYKMKPYFWAEDE